MLELCELLFCERTMGGKVDGAVRSNACMCAHVACPELRGGSSTAPTYTIPVTLSNAPRSAIHACAVFRAALHLNCIAMSSTRMQQKHTLQLLVAAGGTCSSSSCPPTRQPHAAAEGVFQAHWLQTCSRQSPITACWMRPRLSTSADKYAAKLRKSLQGSVVCSHAWHHAGLAGVQRRACWRSASPATGWRLLAARKKGGVGSCPKRQCEAGLDSAASVLRNSTCAI